jgi:hypothetical protein
MKGFSTAMYETAVPVGVPPAVGDEPEMDLAEPAAQRWVIEGLQFVVAECQVWLFRLEP